MKVLKNIFSPIMLVVLLAADTSNAYLNRMVYLQYGRGHAKDHSYGTRSLWDKDSVSESFDAGYIQTWRGDSPVGGGLTVNATTKLAENGKSCLKNGSGLEQYSVNAGISFEAFRFLIFSIGPRFTWNANKGTYANEPDPEFSYDMRRDTHSYGNSYVKNSEWTVGGFMSLSLVIPLSKEVQLIGTLTQSTNDLSSGKSEPDQQFSFGVAYAL